MKELHNLKCKWTESKYIHYEQLSEEKQKELEEECKTILKNIMTYEKS